MSKYPYLFCGNIGTRCPEKLPDGRCKLTERLDEVDRCPDSVMVENPDCGLVIRYLYSIRNNVPRVIVNTSMPLRNHPDTLYCGQIDKTCPHQTPGGKCKRYENIPDYGPCEHQVYLTPEMELAVRLLQFAHRDSQKQK